MPAAPFLLAASLSDASPQPDPGRWDARARAAEAAGLDFVTIEAGPLDPLLVAARLAARTERIGLVPAARPNATEPFHVSTAIATIDVISHGRAGWLAELAPRRDVEGSVTWEVPDDAAGDAAEHVEAVRQLWDSWEDGAEIRDAATSRFVDRERLHHVNFQGRHLSVRGPSITPRPPQGQPVVAVRAGGREGRRLAAGHADVLLTADLAAAPAAGLLRMLEVPAGGGLADGVLGARDRGFDGAVIRADDLAGALAGLIPALAARGAAPQAPAGGTLRARLGLAPAVNRHAAAR